MAKWKEIPIKKEKKYLDSWWWVLVVLMGVLPILLGLAAALY